MVYRFCEILLADVNALAEVVHTWWCSLSNELYKWSPLVGCSQNQRGAHGGWMLTVLPQFDVPLGSGKIDLEGSEFAIKSSISAR